ncbi:MAG: PAC2 family protein [Trueperella sp.]|nr:PAC2 family protein [Trueperella sp.]
MRFSEAAAQIEVPCMIMNLIDPLVDAGDTAQTAHASISSLDFVEMGKFDSDPLFDYRAQRPIITYHDGRIEDVAVPEIRLSLVTDVLGNNFLYLSGQEPDFRWGTLAEDLLQIAEYFGVKRIFTLAAMPAPVPHTRPADMLLRTTTELENVMLGKVEHYGALADYFEFFAGKAGIDVTNIRVRVPLYLAVGENPFISGALAAMKMIATLGGPTLPLGDLEQLEDQQNLALTQMIEAGSEFEILLKNLEEEYDRTPLKAGLVKNIDTETDIPTSEEIGKAAELFLSMRDGSPLDRAQRKEKTLGDPEHPRSYRPRRGRHHYSEDRNSSTSGPGTEPDTAPETGEAPQPNE